MSDFVKDLPAELQSLISKSLSKDVEGRYQTSSELRAETNLIKIKKRIELGEDVDRSDNAKSTNLSC